MACSKFLFQTTTQYTYLFHVIRYQIDSYQQAREAKYAFLEILIHALNHYRYVRKQKQAMLKAEFHRSKTFWTINVSVTLPLMNIEDRPLTKVGTDGRVTRAQLLSRLDCVMYISQLVIIKETLFELQIISTGSSSRSLWKVRFLQGQSQLKCSWSLYRQRNILHQLFPMGMNFRYSIKDIHTIVKALLYGLKGLDRPQLLQFSSPLLDLDTKAFNVEYCTTHVSLVKIECTCLNQCPIQ